MPSKPRLQPLARAVLHTQTDERLVALARRGKDAAFTEIVRRYRPGLVAFAAAYGPPDPEDVVQESLVRAWDALRDSTGEMHLKAWLYTIVRNRALNAKRDTRVHEELTEQIDGVRQPAEIVLTNEELDRVVGVVAALPEQQREALVRSALEGHTHEQIAGALGSTPGAVRQLIYRARLTVRHGVGFFIPLPLVAMLAELGTAEAAGVAGGAAAGGAAAAGGGASIAAKIAAVAAVGAVAVGSGVAIERSRDGGENQRVTLSDSRDTGGGNGAGDGSGSAAEPAASSSGPGPSGQAAGGGDDDRGGSGSDDSGGEEDGDDGADDDSDSDDSGVASDDSGEGSEDSGSGSDDSGDGSDDSGSGSGSSGSGSSGSSGGSGRGSGGGGNSGPGGGDSSGHGDDGDAAEPAEVEEPEDDSSGPGSGDVPEPEPVDDSSGPGGGGGEDPDDD
jgi:RNA polymerase sigma factor (sigma-70 family)